MNAPGPTHSKVVGYILWIFGFTGAHRFYFGKPISGTIISGVVAASFMDC